MGMKQNNNQNGERKMMKAKNIKKGYKTDGTTVESVTISDEVVIMVLANGGVKEIYTWENVASEPKKPKSRNRFLTSDIKLHKDSQGDYYADHKYQGVLIESIYFNTRTEARREAVEVLMDIKEGAE